MSIDQNTATFPSLETKSDKTTSVWRVILLEVGKIDDTRFVFLELRVYLPGGAQHEHAFDPLQNTAGKNQRTMHYFFLLRPSSKKLANEWTQRNNCWLRKIPTQHVLSSAPYTGLHISLRKRSTAKDSWKSNWINKKHPRNLFNEKKNPLLLRINICLTNCAVIGWPDSIA